MDPEIEMKTRCAIYTRKSVDSYGGDFGSLEAQRSICSAYISSQSPKGWSELAKHYDDLGESGGTLERPALQELLRDVESGLIDIIVIYKLDRITRTLLDFVRLMDLLGSCGVHFVSVTQNFDTADSTGRLIQNILLTFAQFEREMCGDRLRDKFKTMKQRGMFVGGHPPYGFDLIEKKLVPNIEEAEVVRLAFSLYLKTKSLCKVAKVLREKGVQRKSRVSKRGHMVAGRGICQGAVCNMLRNPVYVGNVRYKGDVYPGLHDAIVSQELWDKVQALRAMRTRAKVVEKYKTDMLRGLMFDAYGRTVGVFRDFRYNPDGTRYYRSNQNEWGRRNGVRMYRTKADDFDELITSAICSQLSRRDSFRSLLIEGGASGRALASMQGSGTRMARTLRSLTPLQIQSLMRALIDRVDIGDDEISVLVRPQEFVRFAEWNGEGMFRRSPETSRPVRPAKVLTIATSTVRMKRDLRALLHQRKTPLAVSKNPYLMKLVRSARRAQKLLDDRAELSICELAQRCHCTNSRLPRLLRLNYLAPDIIASILDGRQPNDLTGHKLMAKDLPLDWSIQRKILGFAEQQDSLQGAPGW